jgi:hypothetical protein
VSYPAISGLSRWRGGCEQKVVLGGELGRRAWWRGMEPGAKRGRCLVWWPGGVLRASWAEVGRARPGACWSWRGEAGGGRGWSWSGPTREQVGVEWADTGRVGRLGSWQGGRRLRCWAGASKELEAPVVLRASRGWRGGAGCRGVALERAGARRAVARGAGRPAAGCVRAMRAGGERE